MLRPWKINQSITGCIIAFGGFGFGCGLSWTATALPNFEETGQIGLLSSEQKAWIGSLLAIGALIASPIAGYFMDGRGRKTCLYGYSVVGFTGWTFLACATSPVYVYIGRLLTGITVGGYTIVVPVYIGEISSKENRGLIGSFFVVFVCLGKLYSNVVGIAFSASFASVLCSLHPLIFGILMLLIPESPAVLMKQNKNQQAYKSLCWLESTGFTSPFCTFSEITLGTPSFNPESNSKVTWSEFFSSPELIKPILIVVSLMLLDQFCGINVTTFYTVEIFQLSGDIVIDPKSATVILQIIQTIGCLPCSMFVDKYGRRFLLTSSLLAMGLSMAGFTVYFYIKDANETILTSYPSLGLIPLIALVIYNIAYFTGVGSLIWIILSEILPPKIKGPGSTIANITFWGAAFVVTQAFQMFKSDIPIHIWFLFFSLTCFTGCLFNMCFLPETKGLSLQEIQAFFSKKRTKTGGFL